MPHVFRKTLRLVALTSKRWSILVYSIVIVRAYRGGTDTAHSSHLFKRSVWIVYVISYLFRVKDGIVASAWEIGPIPCRYLWNDTWSTLFLNAEVFKVLLVEFIVSRSATLRPIIARWRCSTELLIILDVTLVATFFITILVPTNHNFLAIFCLSLKFEAMSFVLTSYRGHFRGSSYSLIEGPLKLLIQIRLEVLLEDVWHFMTICYFNVAVTMGTMVMLFLALFLLVASIVWFCTWRWHLVSAVDANATQSNRKFWRLRLSGAMYSLRWSHLLTTGLLDLPGLIFFRFNSLMHNLILIYGLLYQLSFELGNEHFLLNLNDLVFLAAWQFLWILPRMSSQLCFARRTLRWRH